MHVLESDTERYGVYVAHKMRHVNDNNNERVNEENRFLVKNVQNIVGFDVWKRFAYIIRCKMSVVDLIIPRMVMCLPVVLSMPFLANPWSFMDKLEQSLFGKDAVIMQPKSLTFARGRDRKFKSVENAETNVVEHM